jgi:ABC-type transporter MlaC component
MGKNFKLGITSLGILTFGYFLTYPFFDVYTNRIITKNFSEDSTNVPEVNERDFVTQFQEYVKENRSNLLKDYKNRKKIVNSNLLKQHMSGNKLIGGNPE